MEVNNNNDILVLYENAKKNDSESQLRLAKCYQDGQGICHSLGKAFLWGHKAAESGLAEAQDFVAWLFKAGYIVPQDEGKAMYWFQKAKENGYQEAEKSITDLNRMYCYMYNGNKPSKTVPVVIDDYVAEISDYDINKDIENYTNEDYSYCGFDVNEFEYWKERAALDEPMAQFFTGYLYLDNYNKEGSEKQGIFWLKKAQEKGIIFAQDVLDNYQEVNEPINEENTQAKSGKGCLLLFAIPLSIAIFKFFL